MQGGELEAIMAAWPDEESGEETTEQAKETSAPETTEENESEESDEEQSEEKQENEEQEESDEESETETSEEETDDTDKAEESEKKTEAKEPEPFIPNAELHELIKEEGKEFKTKDEFEGAIAQKIKSLSQTTAEYADVSAKLRAIIEKNPEMAKLIKALGEGKHVLDAIVESELHLLVPKEDDFDYEAFKKKVDERSKQSVEQKKTQEQLEQAINQSYANIVSYAESKKLGETFVKQVVESIGGFSNGNISNEYLSVLEKGYAYDQKVKELEAQVLKAKESGLVQGRNEKIVKQKDKQAIEVEIPDVASKSKKAFAGAKLDDNDKMMLELNNRSYSI